jgi:hypothetical protein
MLRGLSRTSTPASRPTIAIDGPIGDEHRDVGAFGRHAGGVPIPLLEVFFYTA